MSTAIKLETSLKANLFWDYFNRFGNTLIGLITSIILARILNPSEFGIVGIAMAVNAIGSVFLNLGFVNGIIQSKSIDNKMLSTAFYINLLMALFIYIGIFISSKWVSNYYGLIDLEKILKISAIAFLFNAMSLISYAYILCWHGYLSVVDLQN
jgi:teichuronic acid exporter